MKKLLLASTALAAVALAPGEGWAQAAPPAGPPIKLGLGGYFQFYGVFADQDDNAGRAGASRHNFDFKREGEIWFLGQAKLDNGLMIGVDVQLEAESCGDQIDESYIWFQGGWGRLILGSENSAAYLLSVGAPTVDANFDGQDPNYRLFNTNAGFPGDPRLAGAFVAPGASALATQFNAIDASVVNISTDAEKLTYLSPRIFGFRAGLSYTPDNSEDGTAASTTAKGGSFAGMLPNNNIGQYSNVIGFGANYEGAIGPASLLAGVSYETAFREQDATLGGVRVFKDRRQAYSAGFDVGFAGLHVGALYFTDDNGFRTQGEQKAYAVGLTYTMGPLTVGANYYDSRRDVTSAAGGEIPDERLRRMLVGGRYVLGPGVDLRSSVQYYNYDAPSTADANDNHAWVFVLGTNFTF
jgi:outer membrane protein OmpU